MKNLVIASALLATGAVFADADLLEREGGIKIGQRLTLRPYLNLSCSFDSNPDSERDDSGCSDVYWSINPGATIDFDGENWKVNGSVYYQYHAYCSDRQSQLSNSSYGEQLGITWSSADDNGGCWSLMLSERYQVVNQADDFKDFDGKGLWRDRQQLDVSAAFSRRFNERWHASVNASYYWLDYANDINAFAPLYGWGRWTAGLQLGCTLSRWTDLFITANYQGYNQDNGGKSYLTDVSGESQGWTVHAGIGSYLTDRITYRVSAGFSTFEYGDKDTSTTFTYQGDLNWKVGETWSTTLLFSSYYQPSEREYATAVRCDNVSWGLSKSLIRGKMSATLDFAYRRDSNMYADNSASDWDLNLITARIGLNYTINRFVSVFARGEFQTEVNGGEEIARHYDYERWRATIGMRLTY